ERIQLRDFTQIQPFLRADFRVVGEPAATKTAEIEALQRNVLTLFQQIVAGSATLSDELATVAMNIDEPGRVVDFIASSLPSRAITSNGSPCCHGRSRAAWKWTFRRRRRSSTPTITTCRR